MKISEKSIARKNLHKIGSNFCSGVGNGNSYYQIIKNLGTERERDPVKLVYVIGAT